MAKRISQLTEETSVAVGDQLPLYDVSSGSTKRTTVTNLLAGVTAGTLISNAAIKAKHVDLGVADQTARDAIASPWEGLLVYRKDTDKQEIYDGSAWRTLGGWELLGKTTLGSAGDTITLSSLPARKYLKIYISVLQSGAITATLRFNNDSATNYAYNTSTNGAASSLVVSQTSIIADVDGTSTMKFISLDVINISAQPKSVLGIIHSESASGAANAPGMRLLAGKWHNTSAQVTRIDVINTAAGDFAIGSEVLVLGADF